MNRSARRLLGVALVVPACVATAAHAQQKPADYPKKPIRIVVGIAPAGTPRAVIRAINAVVSQGMNSPDTLKALAAEGSEVAAPATPEEFKAKFERDYAETEKLVRAANIRIN